MALSRMELSQAPNLSELASLSDTLLALEVHIGCFGPVERLLAKVSKLILEGRVSYSDAEDEQAIERIWINLLRLGLLDELRHLIDQHKLPIQPGVKMFIDFCAREYVVCRKRGESYRAARPDRDIFTMGCIVWGETYIGNFLRYNLRSMLSANNLPRLNGQGEVVLSIVTDAAGERQMRRDSVFAKTAGVADIQFIVVPDEIIRTLSSGHLVRNFYILYGMLDHCSIFFAEGARSHLFMIPVDAIVADGSLENMANYRHEGYECCGGGNIVANTETFLPALEARYPGDGPISISTEDLATLSVEHAHHYFISQIIAVENVDFGKHPRELFWPREDGVEIHSVFIHPLFTSASGLANYRRKHYANIDYGMIPRLFAGSARIKIIENPREAYVNNFTATDRLYETTGSSFAIADFLRCHDWTYPVQKSLFQRAQLLPCRLKGWTAYRDAASDVSDVCRHFRDERARPREGAPALDTDLTIILPTRNRPELCKAQIHFLQGCCVPHRVIVADSSDQPDSDVMKACTGLIEYRQFDPSMPLETKTESLARSITTPYVALITDDDISLPHAIDACLGHLEQNPEYVAAQGYVLDASVADSAIDVHGVRWFIGDIADSTPLQRLYELMRRYQPFYWAVFRTPAYIRAVEAANAAQGAFFKELAFTAAITFLGKSARLPMVQTLRTNDDSQIPIAQGHPFHWFLKDAQSFFAGYARYREHLLELLQALSGRKASRQKAPTQRIRQMFRRVDDVHVQQDRNRQTIDLIHASYFGREIDTGMINHAARMRLGERLAPIVPPKPAVPGSAAKGDVVHLSSIPSRHYVWRSAVVTEQPEVKITEQEMARVEAALDEYDPRELAHGGSALTVFEQPLIRRPVKQYAALENVLLQTAANGFQLTEQPRNGYHRILMTIEGGCAGSIATVSLLAKPMGCTGIKLELHDDGAKRYGTSTFDLGSGELWRSEGSVEHSIKSMPHGYFQLSLGLTLTTDTAVHFTLSLLDADLAVIYAGHGNRGIRVRELDVRQSDT